MSTDNQKLISFIEGRLRGDALCMPAQAVEQYRTQVFEAALASLKAAEGGLTAADYEEVLADQRRLVRELDVLINGENAAQQASLCDIVAQVRSEGLKAAPAAPADLIMQVRRLVHALKNANPDHSLVKQVPDYMRRMGYWSAGDCLRGEEPAPGGEHG